MGGLRHLTGETGRVPVRAAFPSAKTARSAGRCNGTIGVLTAPYHRRVNGGRQTITTIPVIDVALHEAVFNVMESLLPEYSAFGEVREPIVQPVRRLPGIAPSNAYRCADGVVLIAGE